MERRTQDGITLDAPTLTLSREPALGVEVRRVLVLDWSDGSHAVALTDESPLIVGRGEGCHVRVPDRSVSREHARLTPGAVGVLIEDLGSRHGLVVQNQRVQTAELLPGQQALLGNVSLTLVVRRSPIGGRSEGPSTGARARTSEQPASMLVLSPQMQETQKFARKAASSKLPVLILGESGTGKELVARGVHEASQRKDAPFRAINCGAIPSTLMESVLFGHVKGAFTGAAQNQPGVFEDASTGTVFLDEIAELSANAQAALLRVLETGSVFRLGGNREIKVDVRLVSATHRNLEQMVEQGSFRLDLLHRLNAFTLELPPLRDRPGEILPLAELFLGRCVAEASGPNVIHPATHALLEAYAWPGNVRELRNVIERAFVVCDGDVIMPEDLPSKLREPCASTSERPASGTQSHGVRAGSVPPAGSVRERLKQDELTAIRAALGESQGNRRLAAERLGMPIRTLERRIREYGLGKAKT